MQKILKRAAQYLLAAVAMFSLTGCSLISLDDFTLLDARLVELDGMSHATLELTVENRSGFKVRIDGGRLAAIVNDNELGYLELENEVVLPRRATTSVQVEMSIHFSSPLAALRAVKIIGQNPDAVTVSGYGEGRIWIFRKRMERNNVPVSKFIDIFGAPSDYL